MNLLCCCTMAPNTKVTRKWELFAGRNRFYCDGLLMSAPHTGVFYLTCFLITGTSILFFVFDCPYLATRITPAIPIVGAILYFFTMSSLLRTTFTDPGVIPRASHDEAAYIEKQIEVPNSLNSPTYRPPPRTKEVLVKGQTVKLKYCFTCKIFRPPRASHCSLCDNCVDRFDHHCPWVGNCVGKRNYRFFYMFLVSLAFLAVFIFSCSITHLVLVMKIEQEVFEVIKKAPFSVIVTFICFFSIWSVIGLAGFHTYLTTSDQTTNEDLKGSFSSKGGQRAVNPYSRGNICLNCFHILCGPMTPSLIDRRGIVTDEYILQMQHSNQYQLTDVTTTPSALITSQPMLGGAVDAISTKQRLYDENIPSSGIYRHRSYDNLQNGNSNSLAHLVDNEIPLSIIEGPCCQTDENSPITTLNNNNNNNYDDDNDNNDNDDDDDDDNIEKINNKHLNNLNGSYNNLFRDNLEDNNYCEQNEQQQQQHIQLTNLIKSTSESENVYSNIINTNQSTNTNNNNTTSTTINDDIIVTNANTTTNLPSSTTATINRLDLHLYSNLIEEQQQKQSHSLFQQQPQQHQQQQTNDTTTTTTTSSNLIIPITISEIPTQTTTTPTTPIKTINIKKSNEISSSSNNKLIINSNKNHLKVNHNSNNSNNCISNNSNNCIKTNDDSDVNRYESSSNDDIMSSTLLSDDLDLDDPVSAFVVNNTCKNKQQQQHHTSTRKMKTTTSTSAASSSSSIQPKHTNKFVNDDDKKNTSSISNNCYNSNNVDTSTTNTNTSSTLSSTTTPTTTTAATTNFITPSRLRLLHDTTMIDTALDLDSLDGSSIGNNSQACLVKTAMV